MTQNINVVKKIETSTIADKVSFSNTFVRDFFNEKDIDISINALRIIFNIINNIRTEQFQPQTNERQLKLFENEFKTENNSFVSVTLVNSNIDKTGSTKYLKEAFEFLVDYKKDWHESINHLGKKIQSYGGLISNPTYENGKTTVLINSYWYEKLLLIANYNEVIFNIVYKIKNNKHILFLFWLMSLPNGTTIKLETLQEKFNLNYQNKYDFERNFLHKVKLNLDKYSDISFNYKYNSVTKIYSIKKINLKDSSLKLSYEEDYKLSEETYKHINISEKYFYLLKRHKIMLENSKLLKMALFTDYNLIVDSYNSFKKKIKSRDKNEKLTDYQDKEFLNLLQEEIELVFKTTTKGMYQPNSFPRINF